MAFTTQELWRLRYELGYPLVTVGALPYIDLVTIFEQVIAQYMNEGADTTSSTAVVAATTPTLVTLTLASAVGFTAQDRVYVDVDDAQEFVTVRFVTGNTIGVFLTKAHAALYPVTVDGGVARARAIFRKLDSIDAQLGSTAMQAAGIKKVDEIEFFANARTGNSSVSSDLERQRKEWRQELADTLGVTNLRAVRRSSSQHRTEVY